MAKFTGTFVQVVENVYQFEIEADNQEEALKKIRNDPFNYLKIGYPVDNQELDVKDIEFEETI